AGKVALVELEPGEDRALVDLGQRGHDFLHFTALLANLDPVARAKDDARDVEALAVHQHVAVAHELPRLGAREGEAEAVNDAVEPRLEQAEHLLARPALPARRIEVILLELALDDAVDAADLLLLPKANRVLAQLDARLAVLARRVRPAGVRALL